MAGSKNDEDSVSRKIDDGVWRGEVTATLKAIQSDNKVLFKKLDEHIKEDKKEFDKAQEARAEHAEKVDDTFDKIRQEFIAMRSRIGKSEIRLAVAGSIATIVFALILTFGGDIIDAWRGNHSHDKPVRAKE